MRDDKYFDILKEEYILSVHKIEFIEGVTNSYVNYCISSVAALGTILAFFVGKDGLSDRFTFSVIFSIGVLVIGLLSLVLFHYLIQCYSVGGYIKYLEFQFYALFDVDFIKWESIYAPRNVHKSNTSRFLYALVLTLFAALQLVSIYVCIKYIVESNFLVGIVLMIVSILELITACIFTCKCFNIHQRTFDTFINNDIAKVYHDEIMVK